MTKHIHATKFLSLLLTLAIVLTFIPALSVPALAKTGPNVIDFDDFNFATDGQSTDGWSYSISTSNPLSGNPNRTFTITDNVEFTGTVNAGNELVGTIAIITGGYTVTWNAALTFGANQVAITLQGGGIFNLPGGSIAATGSNGTGIRSDEVAVNVIGGTVSGGAVAINAGFGSVITVSGGTVSGEDTAILGDTGSTINISGGKVTNNTVASDKLETIYSNKGIINVSGGTVRNSGTGAAIGLYEATLNIGSGATLSSGGTTAIKDDSESSSSIIIDDDAVISTGYTGGDESVEIKYTVTFNSNGGSAVSSQSITANGAAARPYDPAKAGFKFDGWYSDAALTQSYDFSEKVTKEVTLYAKWSAETVVPEVPYVPPAWVNPFKDVAAGAWYYGDVEYAVVNGLFAGTSATTFSPNTTMTRSMIVMVLFKLNGAVNEKGAVNPFTDVSDDSYYTAAVIWAAANGIISGDGGYKFLPDEPISRQDLSVILLQYADYAGLKLPAIRAYSSFADNAQISGYAANAVKALYSAGIISGKPANKFAPKGIATRSEVAAILHGFIEAAE